MTTAAVPGSPTSSPSSGVAPPPAGTGRGPGLFQRLIYLLVALALHRAARQSSRRAAEAPDPATDPTAAAAYAQRLATERGNAENSLQTMDLATMGREDIALALTDAVSWADSSPIARAALDRLREYYRREYGLVIDAAGRTLTLDANFPVAATQTRIDADAAHLRRRSAAAAVTGLIAENALPAGPAVGQALSAWANADPSTTPDTIADHRRHLAHTLDQAPLLPSDRAHAGFLLDYLTGDHTHPHAADLLDTPLFTPPLPTVPTPPPPTPPLPQSVPAGSVPASAHSGTRSPAPDTPGVPATEFAGPPTPPDNPPAPAPAVAAGAPTGEHPHRPPPSPQTGPRDPGPSGPEVRPAMAGAGVDRGQITDRLRGYVAEVRKLHRLADRLDSDRALPLTEDMHALAEGVRTRRHELLAVATHGVGLAAAERTQLRAIVADIDTGNTTLPTLLWMAEGSKRAADEHLHRTRAHAIATDALTQTRETLDTAGILDPHRGQRPSRLPAELLTPLNSLCEALDPDTGYDDQRRDRFDTATAQLHRRLVDLELDTARIDDLGRFLTQHLASLPAPERADRAIEFVRTTLVDAGVALDTGPDPGVESATLTELGAVIEAAATGTDSPDRLQRRYHSALDTLTRQAATAGADPDLLTSLRTDTDRHLDLARAHRDTGHDRLRRWNTRTATHTHTAQAHSSTGAPAPGAQHVDPETRRKRFWRHRHTTGGNHHHAATSARG